jgi:hypothetical protein
MVSKAEEASAEYSLVVYSSAHISYWSRHVRDLQTDIGEKNYLFLEKVGWIGHYKKNGKIYEGQKIIKDEPETFYLALIKKSGSKAAEHLAHFKIAPQGDVTGAIGQNHFEKTAEQLIAFEAARSGFGIFSKRNTNTFSDRYLKEKGGYYTINPSEDAAEIIQFCGDKKYVLPLLLGAYMMGTYPKEDINKLTIPSFKKNRNPTFEEEEEGRRAKDNFLNIFNQKIFYGTSGASSVPSLFIAGLNEAFRLWGNFKISGLNEYIDSILQKDNPYKVFNKEKKTYEITDPNNSDKWENHTKKQWEEILALWENHMAAVSEKKSVTTEDFEKAHQNFVGNLSQINSVASFIAKAVGIDPVPLGPILPDLNKPNDYYRAFLWPPFALSTQDPYHFGSEMFRKMYEYVRENLGIDFSQVSLLGPTLKPVFPGNYHEKFCERELQKAKLLGNHLGEPDTSNYRVLLPEEYFMIMQHHHGPQTEH